MLIIGHRGAKGDFEENTIESLQFGIDEGADILEFDVRMTSDRILIMSHDPKIYGLTIAKHTLAELRECGHITLLKDVLDTFFGEVLLNLEYKPARGMTAVNNMISSYIKKPSDWDNIIVSSFHVRSLARLRYLNKDINLALLHSMNPYMFVPFVRTLNLTAVGWHRLHVNDIAIEVAKRAGLFTYVYTANRAKTVDLFALKGIDGIVTDYPRKFQQSN